MEEGGINFGSFDFSIDLTGQWWFLEVNTQGQFLWLENEVELGLLENFARFIVSKDDKFKGSKELNEQFSHQKFCESSIYIDNVATGNEPQEDWFYSTE